MVEQQPGDLVNEPTLNTERDHEGKVYAKKANNLSS